MKSPWINMQASPPKQMSVFKSEKKRKKEEHEPDENHDSVEIESECIFKPAELADEVKETRRILDVVSRNDEDYSCQIQSTTLTPFTGADTTIAGIQDFDQGKGCYLTKKIPFSVHAEIDDFLHDPICGAIAQNTYEYHDQLHQKAPEMDTKLLHTATYYPEQPDCRLVFSEINEIVFLQDAQNDGKKNIKGNHKATILPLHDPQTPKTGLFNYDAYMHIRVPVVLGEYKIEICLDDNVELEEVMQVKKISKEVVLTNFRLVPTAFSPTLNNGTRTAVKGILFIEGYINQKIEYTASQNQNKESITPMTHLSQKMAVDLIIHILQVQKIKTPFL